MASTTLARTSGVLLHPSSLPGPFGIGDFGPEAYRFVEWLASAQQSWWQILPLGPTGAGNSPYQSFSAFAGNVMLLSPELLTREGLLPKAVTDGVGFRSDRVEYEHVAPYKKFVLREAWTAFRSGKGPAGMREEFDAYRTREAGWLDDYTLFIAIHEALGGANLVDWADDVRSRQPAALAELAKALATEVRLHAFGQFLFDRQWTALKTFAGEKKVRIIGDAPIFVSADSADVWAHPELFLLGRDGRPTTVAGVPPDYFSATGQHWGNPLYDWARMADSRFTWWVERVRRLVTQVDLARIDHFRGFAAAWHIPASDTDARNGKWVPGPGRKLFDRLKEQLGDLPLIAEDLGLITDDVHQLRQDVGLPGMRVLQFALGGPASPHWPHNYEPHTVAYTGTHDNDTTHGWYTKLSDADRWTIGEYLGREVTCPAWDFIRFAWASVARLAVTPMQDVLELGTEARMNVPGVAEGNWTWRVSPEQIRPELAGRLAHLTTLFHRVPASVPEGGIP